MRAPAEETAENAPLAVQTVKRAINTWAEPGKRCPSMNFASDRIRLGCKAMAGEEKAKAEGK